MPPTPCYLCQASRSRAVQNGSAMDTNAAANTCFNTSPFFHLPSTSALSSAIQLAAVGMAISLQACLDLMPACCSFIEQEYLASLPSNGNRTANGTPWKHCARYTFRGMSVRECDHLMGVLLAGMMDSMAIHFANLAASEIAAQGAASSFASVTAACTKCFHLKKRQAG